MASSLRSIAADGRVPLRIRVSPRVAEALHDEALRRRSSASQLVELVLRSELPTLAEERVRAHLDSPARERLAGHLPADTAGPEPKLGSRQRVSHHIADRQRSGSGDRAGA